MDQVSNKKWTRTRVLIGIISVAVPVVVALLILFPQSGKLGKVDVSFLPVLNASLNSFTAVVLVFARLAIGRKKERLHRNLILLGFGASTLFLISYVLYHYQADPTSYGGDGFLRYLYYFILVTHVVLAALVLPLILLALFYGLTDQRSKHRGVVKFAFPIWLYVAITGVLVYLLISPYYP